MASTMPQPSENGVIGRLAALRLYWPCIINRSR
jgi:hypothetical protein